MSPSDVRGFPVSLIQGVLRLKGAATKASLADASGFLCLVPVPRSRFGLPIRGNPKRERGTISQIAQSLPAKLTIKIMDRSFSQSREFALPTQSTQ